MLLAELEIRHSRAIAPTRRVALGKLWLPTEPPPGDGPLLLAGIVAATVQTLEEDEQDGIELLLDDVEAGRHIPQPRLRHRFQADTHGLDRSHHRLVRVGEGIGFEIDDHGLALQQALGAIYAAAKLTYVVRPATFRMLRKAQRWEGWPDHTLATYLTGDEAPRFRRKHAFDSRWALEILEFGADDTPERTEVQKRFRKLVRDAHPDHGAVNEGAGERILELTEAKRILLSSAR